MYRSRAPDSQVLPARIEIAPGETIRRTVAVRLPGNQSRAGELTLLVTSPEQRVIVQGSRMLVAFHEASSFLLVALLLFVAGGSALIWLRRRRQRKFYTIYASSVPRRLS